MYVDAAEDMEAEEAQQIYNKMLFDVMNDEISCRRKTLELAQQYRAISFGHLRNRGQCPAGSLEAAVKAQLIAQGGMFWGGISQSKVWFARFRKGS